MNAHLCDTNVISELMRREPHREVAAWMVQRERVALSVITVEEIVFGLCRRRLVAKADWFDRFIAAKCEVLPVDERVARRAGELRGQLSICGETRTQADLLIAATAAVHGLIVVTRNVRDFEGTAVPVLNPFS